MSLSIELSRAWNQMQNTQTLQGVSLDFTKGFFFEQKDYKYYIRERAKAALMSKEIKRSIPGTGEVTQIALRCLECAREKASGILVDWRIVDKLRRNESSMQFESAIQRLVSGPSKAEYVNIFDDIQKSPNSNFQVAAFLFYAQDPQQFLPISQRRFDLALDYLHTNVQTSYGTGQEYVSYLEICRKTSQWLKEVGAITKYPLQDAHSFLFWLGWLIKYGEINYSGTLVLDDINDQHSTISKVQDNISSLKEEFIVLDEAKDCTSDLENFIVNFGTEEGKKLYASHVKRERDPKIVKDKKAQALALHGCLTCEACDFDFEQKYGKLGEQFIECHHLLPLSLRPDEGSPTRLEDLSLLCSNCHRMIHRPTRMLTVEDLRKIINGE